MKKVFYRLSSSRSFAKLLSILAFAALGLLWFSGAAHAWGTGPSSTPFGFSGTLECTGGPFSGTLTPTTSNASETATVTCTAVAPINGQGGTGTFELFVSYVGIQSSCDTPTSVRTYSAFCQSGTTVSGTLTWVGGPLGETLPDFCGGNNPCVLNIGGFPTKNNGTIDSNDCSTVFPATDIFAVKQVFLFQEVYHGPNCTGSIEPQDEHARYCHSDTFSPSDASQCIVKVQGVTHVETGVETTGTGIVVSIDVQPNHINTSCGGNKDSGIVTGIIFGSPTFDVSLVDTTSLTLDGVPVQAGSCNTVFADAGTIPDLQCKFPSCPDLGPTLAGTSTNADGTVTVVLQGELTSGKPIQGTDKVNIN